MRAEDFFGYARRISQLRDELEQRLAHIDEEYAGRSETARVYARMPYASEIADMRRYYGEGLDARSHGESYLAFFRARFVPEGLYLLDEPEAPLSPLRQLSFLVMLRSMVEQRGQFIIATHSPIIMAFPGAAILCCDGGEIHEVAYGELEHVTLTRDFLQAPEQYLRHLFADGG
jgi:predicted ATPase